MARRRSRSDSLVFHDNLWLATNAKQKILQVKQIDADSVPGGYLKSFKISVADNTSEQSNLAYSFYAALDDGLVFDAYKIVDHTVISPGGGVAYLNINRSIYNDEGGLKGGPITIWAECSDVADSTTLTITCNTYRLKYVTV